MTNVIVEERRVAKGGVLRAGGAVNGGIVVKRAPADGRVAAPVDVAKERRITERSVEAAVIV